MARILHRVVYVGRKAQDPWLDAAEMYRRRLVHTMDVELVLIRQSDTARERSMLQDALDSRDYVVALDERGKMQTTKQWSDALSKLYGRGHRRLVWLIGGADGLGEDLRARANAIWQLSQLTLPHRAALALLLEQLFRSDALEKNLPYHREG